MTEQKKELPTVLVIDDEEDFLDLMKGNGLRDEGYQVATAISGEDALEYLKEHRPELIMLDVAMPGMDGVALARKLAAMEEISSIPRMFVTAVAFASEDPEIQKLSQDILVKPFDIDVMLEKVKRLVAA